MATDMRDILCGSTEAWFTMLLYQGFHIYSTSWTLLSVLTFSVALRSTTALLGCPDWSLNTASRTSLTVT